MRSHGAVGRSRAAFYSRFLVIGPDHRAACHSHRWGGAISVTIVDAIRTRNALPPPSRGSATPRAGDYAAASFFTSKVDPSRHSAYRMRLRRRAKATTAIRRPRRAASCSTHARRDALC